MIGWVDGVGALGGVQGFRCGPGNHTPPPPVPETSWNPNADGFRGTNSAILVGLVDMFLWSHRKSSSA